MTALGRRYKVEHDGALPLRATLRSSLGLDTTAGYCLRPRQVPTVPRYVSRSCARARLEHEQADAGLGLSASERRKVSMLHCYRRHVILDHRPRTDGALSIGGPNEASPGRASRCRDLRSSRDRPTSKSTCPTQGSSGYCSLRGRLPSPAVRSSRRGWRASRRRRAHRRTTEGYSSRFPIESQTAFRSPSPCRSASIVANAMTATAASTAMVDTGASRRDPITISAHFARSPAASLNGERVAGLTTAWMSQPRRTHR